MKIAFYGNSLTEGICGASYLNILKEQLPDPELINYDKAGDTIISLYRRVAMPYFFKIQALFNY